MITSQRLSEIEAVARAFARGEIDEIPEDVQRDVDQVVRAFKGLAEVVIPALERLAQTLVDAWGRIPPEVIEELRDRKVSVDLERERATR